MDDKFVKYSKLYILLFFLFLSVPVIIGLIVGTFYGVFKLVSSAPVDYIFELLIISIPTAVFSSAYIIFFKRTKQHPVALVRGISKTLFVIGFGFCAVFLVLDMVSFFLKRSYDVSEYLCFTVPFLAGNIGGLFAIALMQAFTTHKEKDWLEKWKEAPPILPEGEGNPED